MEEEPNFLPTKKLLVFGSEGVGKTSLTSVLQSDYFKVEEPSTEGI